MEMVAEQTGGKAFNNMNDLSAILERVVSTSSDFYTISYTPTDAAMNGKFRKIGVSVDGKYNLSYRRGYYAREDTAPGSAQEAQTRAEQHAIQTGADPLGPFMDFGLPQTEQILYTERVVPEQQSPNANPKGERYAVDFTVSL